MFKAGFEVMLCNWNSRLVSEANILLKIDANTARNIFCNKIRIRLKMF